MSADHFSRVAEHYAAFRPSYPDELFDWLASIAPRREQAWDCGAGSGQATIGLAGRFKQVLATDISAAQLAGAPARANVEYRVTSAEASGLQDGSVDLVTVAQAMHWFDLPKFYDEVRRVLRLHGVIAVWGYNRLRIDHPELQRILDRFYEDDMGPYWPREVAHIKNGYRDLPFPFRRISPPPFVLRREWSRAHLLGYLRCWSSVGRFRTAHGHDPVDGIAGEIAIHWAEKRLHRIEWPLFMHVGRMD